MSRHRATTALAGAMLFALSCSIVPVAPPAPLAGPAEPAALGASELPLEEIAVVRAELADRRTGLADDELDALAQTIVAEARRHELDSALVMAVMHVESRFNSFAVSPVGALGIMQIMPATGEELARKHGVRWMGQQTLFDPHVNVRLGVAYLKQLAVRYDSVQVALAAYNWGPGHIDGRLRRGTALPTEYPQLVSEALVAVRAAARRS